MTKSELIEALARRQTHLAFADVEMAVKSVIEQMVVLSPGNKLALESLPHDIRPAGGGSGEGLGGMNNLVGISIEQAEKELIRNTLKLTHGNREQAAKILGIGERTLYRKIKEYEL